MPYRNQKRGALHRRTIANSEPYEVGYFDRKHDISREQARESHADGWPEPGEAQRGCG